MKPRIAEDIAPNLVPMIDIMFLLLLFFMLTADMGQRELEEVNLPIAKSAQDENSMDVCPILPRVTVNVCHPGGTCPDSVCRNVSHWKTRIQGHDLTGAGLRAAIQTQADLQRPTAGGPSERKVMIRVDAAAPYGLAQDALNACAQAGIYRIEVGAALAPR